MRFSTIAAAAASLVVVSAQTPDLSQVPSCAVPCLVAAIPESGCGVSDVKCQCTTGQAAITKSVTTCVSSKCQPEDQAKLVPILAGICESAGISVSVPASLAPSAAASGAASAASSAVASATSAAASKASGASSPTGSAPAESTGGAAANMVGLGAVALGLVFAL